MSLYHKYRPDALEDVVGNEETITALRAHIDKEPAHAFLLTGPSGCGKTTIGRILARLVGAHGEDFREVDSADFRGIDTIREIRRRSVLRSLNGGGARAWLIDECHKMTNDAQNAFLKALEDPPDHVYYILATTDPEKLLATIRGRCQHFALRRLNNDEMLRVLRRAVRGEEEAITKEMYEHITFAAGGAPRIALQFLEQLLAVAPVERSAALKGIGFIPDEASVIDLCRAMIDGSGWKKVSTILGGIDGEDPEKVRRAILGYCTTALLKGDGNDRIVEVMEQFLDPLYDSGFPGLVWAAYTAMKA